MTCFTWTALQTELSNITMFFSQSNHQFTVFSIQEIHLPAFRKNVVLVFCMLSNGVFGFIRRTKQCEGYQFRHTTHLLRSSSGVLMGINTVKLCRNQSRFGIFPMDLMNLGKTLEIPTSQTTLCFCAINSVSSYKLHLKYFFQII